MIDDCPTDVLFTRRAFAAAGIPCELHVAQDGEEGLQFLTSADPGRPEPPDLILLDLNMPRKDGFQVLTELRMEPAIGHIPVIVFTSSTYREDVNRSYALHANAYIAKPVEYEKMKNLILAVSEHWFRIAMLPG